jgi:hypothetical protein
VSDDDLTAAYLAGYHKAKTEMKAQNAELLEALEIMLEMRNLTGAGKTYSIDVARAAIAKAKGESK